MANPQVNYSGSVLVADQLVVGVPTGVGATQVSGYGVMPFLKFRLTGVNFNSATTDNPLTLHLPFGVTQYSIQNIKIINASHTLVTATVGVFTAASAGGTTVAADQAITVTSATANTNNNTMSLTITNPNTTCFQATTLYVRIGTPESAAATGDVVVTIQILD